MLPLRGPERLKLQADTFFLPVEGGVWLRNNRGSFTIKSRPAYQWLEKLAPHLTGAATLDQICAGLSPAHRAFVVDLLSALVRNGFLREVAQPLASPPLPEAWQTHFAQQLELLGHYTDDPAVRFERYRSSRVLCIGAGERLTALVSSLYESGVAHVSALLQGRPDARASLDAVVRHATGRYPDAAFDDLGDDLGAGPVGLDRIDALIAGTTAEYVLLDADGHDHARIAAWERACRRHRKLFLPMVAVGRAIMVGPLVTPDSEVTWECAWRRIHDDRLVAAEPPVASPVTSALAAHVVLYDLFRHVTGALEPELRGRIAMIDEDTLVTHVHPVIAHPLSDTRKEFSPGAADRDAAPTTQQAGATPAADPVQQPYDAVTDSCFGIIAALDPGELSQLPLSQCVCRVGDPLAMGGHRPLAVRATGLSHADVRAESVRLALATYAWRLEAAPGRARRPEPAGVACPPESLLGLDAASLRAAGEAGWCRAIALPGEQPVWVPASALPAGMPRDAAVPAGLAAGMSLAEAVVRGACALVRDLVQADQGFLAGQRVDDLADLPASSSAYLGLLAAAGKQVRIATAETPWGLPWAGAYIDGVCAGHGCHVTPALAVETALGHAASALLVGAADDAPPASPALAAPADWSDALERLSAQVSSRGLGLVAVELTGDAALTRAGYRIARVLLSKRQQTGRATGGSI